MEAHNSSYVYTGLYSDEAKFWLDLAYFGYPAYNHAGTKWSTLYMHQYPIKRNVNGEVYIDKEEAKSGYFSKVEKIHYDRIDKKDCAKAIMNVAILFTDISQTDFFNADDKKFTIHINSNKIKSSWAHQPKFDTSYYKTEHSLMDAKIIYDYLLGMSINDLFSKYPKERVEAIIGQAKNPFECAKEELRRSEVKKLEEGYAKIRKCEEYKFNEQIKEIEKKKAMKLDELDNELEDRIKKLNESFNLQAV